LAGGFLSIFVALFVGSQLVQKLKKQKRAKMWVQRVTGLFLFRVRFGSGDVN
jgi:hypothetical protein